MFGGGASNPYDDIVAKTTDENLTTENWELIMNLCDKVMDEGDEGAHNVVAALLKRLAHRNPNVQLYALSLTDSLSKNCGLAVNKEIASRAFTQGLEKLVTDRTTHDKVRKRALAHVAQWTSEFEADSSLGVMEDCYNNLKSKGYKFETPQEPLPPTVDDEIRRKEEEELQRVLEMSMQDKGGRSPWADYSLASSSGAGGSSSSRAGASGSGSGAAGGSSGAYGAPKYQGGYVPARTPSPQRQPQPAPTQHHQPQPQVQAPAPAQHHSPQAPAQDYSGHYTHSNASNVSANSVPSSSATAAPAASPAAAIVTRVRALHTFEPTEPGELAFDKGDIIKVVDRGYKDWWRGQLKGRTGIFPVNYVEPMPEPTANELAREAEQEAAVFAQAVNVEKLLNMLRAFDPQKDNLADNEEIQELYRSSMALRPKIVKLIDKYSQKRADLVSMNETFVRARTIFDRMMEESLARHTGVYDQPTYRPPYAHTPSAGSIRPDSRTGGRGGRPDYAVSPVGGPPGGYPGYGQPGPMPQAFPEPQPAPAVIGYPASATAPTPGAPVSSQAQVPYGYGSPPPQAQAPPIQQQMQPMQAQPQQYTQPQQQPQPQAQPQPQPQPHPHPQPQQAQQQPQQQPTQQPGYTQTANAPYTAQGPTPYPAQQPAQQQPQSQQVPSSPLPQQQPQYGQSPYQSQPQPQQAQPQQAQPQPTSPSMGFASQQPAQQQPQQAEPYTSAQPQQQLAPQQTHQVDPYASAQPQPQQQPDPYGQHQQQPQQQAPQPQEPQLQPQVQAQPAQQPTQQYEAQPQQAQQQPVHQAQPVQQQQPAQQPSQPTQQQPAQEQQQHQPSVHSGPPYLFDPTATYADPNVQAWAQYYAQGGTDMAGSVYFVSVPGLTDKNQPGGGATAAIHGGVSGSGQGTQGGPTDGSASGGAAQGGYNQQSGQPQDHQQHQPQQPQQNSQFDSGAYGIQPSGGSFLDATSSHQQYHQQQPHNASSTSLGSTGSGGANLRASSPGGNPAYGQSPTAASTTPSWVLPKKDNAGGRPGGGDASGLSGRFAGVSLTDPGSASA